MREPDVLLHEVGSAELFVAHITWILGLVLFGFIQFYFDNHAISWIYFSSHPFEFLKKTGYLFQKKEFPCRVSSYDVADSAQPKTKGHYCKKTNEISKKLNKPIFKKWIIMTESILQ